MEEIIKEFMKQGYLIDPKIIALINNPIINEISSDFINTVVMFKPSKILSYDFFMNNLPLIVKELESKNLNDKYSHSLEYLKSFLKIEIKKPSLDLLEINKEKEEKEKQEEKLRALSFRDIKIIESFNIENKKVTVEDFVKYFKDRFNSIKPLLQEHELRNLTSINKIPDQRQEVSIIGLVYSKNITKNKNIIFELEDMSGKIKVLVRKDKEDLYKKAESIVLDEVIAVTASGFNDILFAKDIIFPEAILSERKKFEKDISAAFIADLHIGSNKFLEENFLKFISWINGELGSEKQKEMARKIKYLFVDGDLVDGVGIYPGQEAELVIKDIYEQYNKAAELFKKIRKDVTIIICPGNHDAVRIIEPQPVFSVEIAAKLYELKNVLVLTNPCVVNIAASKDFSGFNIFMYHGASFDDYGNDVEVLRLNQAFKRPELILHFLLRKRHVAPTHGSTRYFPSEHDPLVIRQVPDVFVSAHLHKSSISKMNNINAVACSCWQSRTPYQEKFGHEPDPCKVPIFDLKSGKINVIDFS